MKKSLGPKTLVYRTPVFVVGTYNDDHRPNAMTAAWGGICNSQPPSVAVSLRKATHTYGNLIKRKAFTVSIPSEDHVKQADCFGLVSGREADKSVFGPGECLDIKKVRPDRGQDHRQAGGRRP